MLSRGPRLFAAVVMALLMLVAPAMAGEGGHVVVVNGTAQDWVRDPGRFGRYQMYNWDFPERIPANTAVDVYVEWDKKGHGDTNAEARYNDASTNEGVVEFRVAKSNHAEIEAEVLAQTKFPQSPTNGANRVVQLGWRHDGNVNFILTGRPGEYVTSGVEGDDWMTNHRGLIGDWPLKHVSIPGTHDSGMYKASLTLAGASDGTVITQTKDIRGQLKRGARYFDIRPAQVHGTWYSAHLSAGPKNSLLGAFGPTIAEVAAQVRAFTREHPGELVIINLSHAYSVREMMLADVVSVWTDGISDAQWIEVLKLFDDELGGSIIRLTDQDRIDVPGKMTLNKLLARGNVLLLLNRTPWRLEFPPHKNVVVKLLDDQVDPDGRWSNTVLWSSYDDDKAKRSTEFPIIDQYSDRKEWGEMAQDQKAKLDKYNNQYFLLSWTLTQQWNGIDNVFNVIGTNNSILELADEANHQLILNMYPRVSASAFPNILYVDAFDFVREDSRDTPVTTLALAINWKRALQFPR